MTECFGLRQIRKITLQLIQVSPDDLTKAVTSYARTSIFHNRLQLMVYASLTAGGMKLQPQKSHLLCQKHAGPRPGHHQLLVTAISSPSSCSDQEEFQICCIISLRFGHISLPQYCSSPGGQRQLSGWQGTAEETKKWQLEPKESCREHGESVGHSVQAGTAFSHFVQRQPHLQQAQTQSQPCCKAPREQIGQLWGKMHSPADALL